MMGTSHTAMGATAGVIAATAASATIETLVLVVALTTVGALLPDLDHAAALTKRLARLTPRALGPIEWLLDRVIFPPVSLLVSRLLGGHRGLTHSLLGLTIAGVAGSMLTDRQGWPWWTAGSVVLGCAVHILGDACTVSGVPLLFPYRHKHRIARLRTGGLIEFLTVVPACILIVAAMLYQTWKGTLL